MESNRRSRLNNTIQAVSEALNKHQDKAPTKSQLSRLEKLINKIKNK